VALLSAIVGFCDVLQQIPRSVMLAPPSFVIFPPLVAELWAMLVAAFVDKTTDQPVPFTVSE
jgi:hypothetical protein